MPTDVKRRGGVFPVRLSLNISEEISEFLDRWEERTGLSRGELARDALEAGLKTISDRYRKREKRLGRDPLTLS